MAEKIDLSIIIISSKLDYLENCLKTLKTSTQKIKSEIILIDNASPDRTGSKISKLFPEVKILRREKLGGFGENNNMGIKIAKGKYVLLLNDDTQIIDKDIFREMLEWMDNHQNVGVVSCGLVNPDKKTYQGSGGSYPSLWKTFAWMTFLDDVPGLDNLIKPYHPFHGWSPFHTNEEYLKKPHKQDWVTGAFYLMRKAALDEVDGFDEDFFLYVEEVELSYRFSKKEWEIWYLPQWKIVHYGQITNGSEKAMIFEMENLKLLYSKHEPKWKLPVLRSILKLGSLLRIIIYTALFRFSLVKIYAKTLFTV